VQTFSKLWLFVDEDHPRCRAEGFAEHLVFDRAAELYRGRPGYRAAGSYSAARP
jgi:hypothetical protein